MQRIFKHKLLKKREDKLKAALVSTTGLMSKVQKSPDEALGDLFDAVQTNRVYEDGKTFVDLIPKKRMRELKREYELEREDPAFNLGEFVARHFYEFAPHKYQQVTVSPHITPREHVAQLWDALERSNRVDRGSLLAVPYKYIVPGGRFAEQFYWDSYFIMLGLAADRKWAMIHGMMKNHAFLAGKLGHIPTANRNYFISRSQPPFFSQMVKLLAGYRGRNRTYAEFLPTMLTEYRFWMKGQRKVVDPIDSPAYARVVLMPNGMILNRYFDNKTTPRPESRLEDLQTAKYAGTDNEEKIFLDLRAGAESGWDFSSRWFRKPSDIHSIHTTDFIPVDLNCLLYQLELEIAEGYNILKQPLLKKKFYNRAVRRAEAIQRYCWDQRKQFYCDYDFRVGKSSGKLTLAGVFPLYAKIATHEQAVQIAAKLEKEFLCSGGLVTTLEDNGQQWDYPNGWAPLQWIAIKGLREYGFQKLADRIRDAWLGTVEGVFARHRKMVEKYDVAHKARLGGGGEYPLQDGFGWTNGVYAVLKDEIRKT